MSMEIDEVGEGPAQQ